MPTSPDRTPAARNTIPTVILRGLLLRCPRCGNGGVRSGWFKTKPNCPHCGFVFDRGERDYWYGGFLINFIAAELVSVVITFGLVIATSPHVPWTTVEILGPVLAIGLPVLAYPFSQMLWLAVDHHVRPSGAGDGK